MTYQTWLGDSEERACEAIYQQIRRTFPDASAEDVRACMAIVRTVMTAGMWRVDVAGYPVSVKGQAAREHLEEVSHSLAQMKMALHQIAAIATEPGGVGQIARDVLRVCK